MPVLGIEMAMLVENKDWLGGLHFVRRFAESTGLLQGRRRM